MLCDHASQGLEKFFYKPRQQYLLRHIILTFLLVFSTLLVGISTNDLKIVLAFNVSLIL